MKTLAHSKFTIIISSITLAIFVTYMFRSESTFSPAENRYLAGRPAITLSGLADGSFMDSFELYVKEQIPMRDGLIKLKALAEQAQMKSENNGVARGSDGYLFEKLVKENPQLDKNEAAIVKFAGETDRPVNVCIVPNSFEILTDKVPAGFPNISEETRINGLYGKLDGTGNVKTINLYDDLRAHKDEYIYYRTDHHWTSAGAYYGYCKLCADMGLEPVKANELDPVKNEVADFYGTYYSKYKGAGIAPDTLTYYDIPVSHFEAGGVVYDTMYDTDKLNVYDKYAMFMHGNEGISVIDTEDDGRDKRDSLIIFKDSYSNCLIPYLTCNYRRIYVIDLRYYPDPVSQLLDENKDADVLLIYNFMHFNEDNHFYRLTS